VSVPVSVAADTADKLRAEGIRASVRAGAVRIGFHVYNTDEDLERLLDVLRC
jgi:selenocysteine lyase/cysteine desulfurase